MRKREEILHTGEIEAQKRFSAEDPWSEISLNQMFGMAIPIGLEDFLEAQKFFFIATADNAGNCDCSFRGRETDVNGKPLPAVKVLDGTHIVFPDFSGNNLFNSLGNVLVNPHIGMLFIDFERIMRYRLNGKADIIDDATLYRYIWPTAQRYILVTVDQVYGNCKARIPLMSEKD